jgi:hypothetical protein
MSEFLWWVFNAVIGIGIGYYAAGPQGAIFLTVVVILGGLFLLLETKLHPMLDRDRIESQKAHK